MPKSVVPPHHEFDKEKQLSIKQKYDRLVQGYLNFRQAHEKEMQEARSNSSSIGKHLSQFFQRLKEQKFLDFSSKFEAVRMNNEVSNG